MPQPSVTKINLKITHVKCHPNFPGANALTEKYHMLSCLNFSVDGQILKWLYIVITMATNKQVSDNVSQDSSSKTVSGIYFVNSLHLADGSSAFKETYTAIVWKLSWINVMFLQTSDMFSVMSLVTEHM